MSEKMKAVITRKNKGQPELAELPKLQAEEGEALVRILRVGIDGTDHEVVSGGHGGFPEDEDYMILGHEAVGVVEESAGDLEEGDVVVPVVRRPPEGSNEYFERGEPDMAPEGEFKECGIFNAHGYMAEYITAEPGYLVKIPRSMAEYGFLVEPISITEKALEHAYASRSAFQWRSESMLVLGNGSLGLLSIAICKGDFERLYCLGRRDRPDPTIDIIERLGATYIDSRETSIPEIPAEYEGMDLILEATGYAPHAFETIEGLAPNGVAALLGIPGPHEFEVKGGDLHKEIVMSNKALIGSVNSHIPHFEAATESIEDIPEWVLDDIITGVYSPGEIESALEDSKETIKNVIEFDTI